MQSKKSLQLIPPLLLSASELKVPHPLQVSVVGPEKVELSYGSHRHLFKLHYRPVWSERVFRKVIEDASNLTESYVLPLVVLPYLSPERLDDLFDHGLSGLDLQDNGLILGSGSWLMRFATGRPNRYSTEQTLKDPYRGRSSLVGRTLLQRPRYFTAKELHEDILLRGGELSIPLVSRTLAALKEDVIVGSRLPDKVYLLQPERLLDRLSAAWNPDKAQILWKGRVTGTTASFLPHLFEQAHKAGVEAVMTGLGSASRHADISMENTAYLYANQPALLLEDLVATPGERFANLEIRALPDEAVLFGSQKDEQGILWASPLQTYIEMQAGDARLQDSAQTLRTRILNRVRDWIPTHDTES